MHQRGQLEGISLANHKSALKRAKQNVLRNLRNKSVRTRIKGAIKAVLTAVEEKDAAKAQAAMKEAQVVIDKGSCAKTLLVIIKNSRVCYLDFYNRICNI